MRDKKDNGTEGGFGDMMMVIFVVLTILVVLIPVLVGGVTDVASGEFAGFMLIALLVFHQVRSFD